MSIFSGKKVLVTGGAGFLGTHFILELLKRGAKVRATTHTRPAQVKSADVDFVQCDLTSPEACKKAVNGMDYVFMCSANTSGAAVMANTPLVHVTPNVVMNTYMMDAAYQAEVKKYVFIGSSAAYPEGDDHAFEENELLNGEPSAVYYPVAWMKRYSEILCQIYATKIKKTMPCLIVRPSNVYGPYDKFEFERSHVTSALLRRVVERFDPLEVWGTGDDERDLIYVDDFMNGTFKAFEYTDNFDVFNIASGKLHSVKQILNTLLEVDNFKNANVQFKTDKPSTIKRRSISTKKAQDKLGFQASVSLAEGFARTIEWYRKSHS